MNTEAYISFDSNNSCMSITTIVVLGLNHSQKSYSNVEMKSIGSKTFNELFMTQ